ncbi:MAG: primosomal protein N' [Bacteroidales bacterium]|nr:primosomal protein N' [Candidatus Latescibacterota bacterium]
MGKSPAYPRFVDVALPVPVDRTFTYNVPLELCESISAGARISVPFGKRKMVGYALSFPDEAPAGLGTKDIVAVIDQPPMLTGPILELAAWMAEYYVQPMGIVLKAVLPASIRGAGRKKGGDELAERFPEEPERPELNPDQTQVFEAVVKSISEGRGERFLLAGVTGSGKTEVYLRCIEEVLAAGRSAIVLVPEIALIPQSTSRFQRRFGGKVSVLHSRLTGPQRSTIWKKAASGEVRVIIGPRSAVFVPVRDLGIIVVDEEQDSSFKQEEKPHYSAIRAAEFRSRNENAALLLGSATPSLESWHEASSGGITSFRLNDRPTGGGMPEVEVVDMREKEGLFSEELLGAAEDCVDRNEQGIILINRRGHANYVQCRSCGWIARCPHCSISLTYHSRGNSLICHYCGHMESTPGRCPRCGEFGVIQKGAGTQRVEMELQNLVPSARVLRMDLDTTKGKTGHLDLLESFGRGEADILMGTQMVAKGHHFPNVTLVGILSADDGLNFPDFRAAERTFQLLSQAAGRTGRGKKGGRVIIQAFAPDHFIYDYIQAHDFDGFATTEIELRRQLRYPPVTSLMLFTLSSRSMTVAAETAERVMEALVASGAAGGDGILGPTPALIEKLRGNYRFHVLARGEIGFADRKVLAAAARKAMTGAKGVDIQWNVDPVNLF